jgi:iron complex outermembrane receptor protein
MSHRRSTAAAVAALLGTAASPPVHCQSAPAATRPPTAGLDAVTVTARPFPSALFDLADPVDVLEGRELFVRTRPTLGETLANEVGVSSTYFGPNASSPIIRGLGGFDIRVLNNGLGVVDASPNSPDHAVALSPLAVDRVEVVRGPAAVMYGGNAVGGVVNTIDGRIAREAPEKLVTGMGDYRYNSANNGNDGAARVAIGNRVGVLSFDGFSTNAKDLKIPGNAWTSGAQALRGEQGPVGTLPNSSGQSWGGGLGGSLMLGDRGYAGVSYSRFDTNYGTVAEPDVRIGLKQDTWNFAGELRDAIPGLNALRVKYGYTSYTHTELAGGTPGTTFDSKGFNLRVEGQHRPIGRVNGAIGLDAANIRFSATGEEAFVPSNRTRTFGAFLYEELPYGPWKFSGGLRISGVNADSQAFVAAGRPAYSRSFTPWSGALGALYSFDKTWSLAGNLSYTQRAPTTQELYADGPHVATGQFEVGNPHFAVVKSTAMDLTLRQRSGPWSSSLGAFYNRFSDFITLLPNGLLRNPETRGVVDPSTATSDELAEALPQFNYTQVPARFWGFEAQAGFPLWRSGANVFAASVQADYVNATNLDNGQPLPLIPPFRFGSTLSFQRDALSIALGGMFAAAQNRVPDLETTTPGYANVFVTANYRFKPARGPAWELFVQGTNLLDQTIRYSTSTLRDIAPLGRRAVIVGVRASF